MNEIRGFSVVHVLIVTGLIVALFVAGLLLVSQHARQEAERDVEAPLPLTPTPALFHEDPLVAARIADSRRIGDLAAIRSALALYMIDSPNPILNRRGICSPAHPFLARAPVGAVGLTTTISASQAVDGTGWIPVDLRGLPGGSPLLTFPVDPINMGNRFYVYGCRMEPGGRMGFALVANLEYAGNQFEARDGGVCPDLYETGTIASYFSPDQLRELFGTC